LQVAVIEFARSHLNLPGSGANNEDANSEEFNPDAKDPLIVFMPEISKTHMGGTMRLGLRTTKFVTQNSLIRKG
jgi:CTP synthase